MRRQHRLGSLEMGVAGENHIRISVTAADEGPLQLDQLRVNVVDGVADPQPEIGRDLVVSAAPRMQLSPDISEAIDQRLLDVHVDVFQVGSQLEVAGLDFCANFEQPLLDLLLFGRGDDSVGG